MEKKKNTNVCKYIVTSHTYSNKVKKKKIAILGPYPPPLGGVAIHIKRVGMVLKKNGSTVFYYDTMNRQYRVPFYFFHMFCFLLKTRPSIVMYHTASSEYGICEFIAIVLIKICLRFDIIFIEHDPQYIYSLNYYEKKLINIALKHVKKQVFIGNLTIESYQKCSIYIQSSRSIESAFLPPDAMEEQEILGSYPNDLFVFLKRHYPLISINAFQLTPLNGHDLYGIYWTVELINNLKKEYPSLGVVFSIIQVGDYEYFEKIQNFIKTHNLEWHIFFLFGNYQLWPILKKVNLFIRPTLSDSCGISVAEALYFNTPVLASDVCVRPKKAVLYKTGDKKDFFEHVKSMLKNIDNNCSRQPMK